MFYHMQKDICIIRTNKSPSVCLGRLNTMYIYLVVLSASQNQETVDRNKRRKMIVTNVEKATIKACAQHERLTKPSLTR